VRGLRLSTKEKVSQGDRIIVHFVMGRINEGDPARARQTAQLPKLAIVLTHFLGIPDAKLGPARRIVAEPLP
jgi:hypothetical protein